MKKSDVIKRFGSQAAVADALTKAGYECSQPAVSKWAEDIPPLRAYQLREIESAESSDSESPSQAA